MAKKTETVIEFTPRSQRCLLKEAAIQTKIDDLKRQIARLEASIQEKQSHKQIRFEQSLHGSKEAGGLLVFLNKEIATLDEEISSLQEQLSFCESEIRKCRPSADKMKARAERQRQLADLATQRLETDHEIDSVLLALRQALNRRAEQSEQMEKLAESVELSVDLDTARFDELLFALPDEMAAQSERWTGWLIGKPTAQAHTYVMRESDLLLPETLAHTGIHKQFDQVDLYAEQARELLRTDRTRINGEVAVNCPPALMPVTAFEEVATEAEERGVEVNQIWSHEEAHAVRNAHQARLGRNSPGRSWVSEHDREVPPLPARKAKKAVGV